MRTFEHQRRRACRYGTGSFLVEGVAGTSLLDAGDFTFA
jgi:hypothetical protein